MAAVEEIAVIGFSLWDSNAGCKAGCTAGRKVFKNGVIGCFTGAALPALAEGLEITDAIRLKKCEKQMKRRDALGGDATA